MRRLVEIPLKHYRELMAKVSESDREYAMLNTGILMASDDNRPRRVVILCEPEQVKLIMDLAKRVYPEGVSDIQEYTAEKVIT